MEYSHITKDQQRQILKGRIAGWESEHWGHEINLAALKASGSTTPDDLEITYKSLAVLEASILSARDQLAALGEEPVNDDTPQP